MSDEVQTFEITRFRRVDGMERLTIKHDDFLDDQGEPYGGVPRIGVRSAGRVLIFELDGALKTPTGVYGLRFHLRRGQEAAVHSIHVYF